ncbi:MAG: peptidoglycan editing factor PgeF [Stagnimonas sp.]|nr:peptidoglycan editing factor PgeF [Stagnimonas sp.]
MSLPLLWPDWPVPANVHAVVSTRAGGVSRGPYASLNLGSHVGDDPAAVAENRRRFCVAAALGHAPGWLNQVHGCGVVRAPVRDGVTADACWTQTPGVPCAVMTADCLPVLFADRDGSCVAAAHAGWRGLADGVLEATVAGLPVPASQLMAWMGPAIGPQAFQVGNEVRAAFVTQAAEDAAAFVADGARWRADLFALARARLARCGVTAIYGGGRCTVSEPEQFFSHRRDGISGRFASVIQLVEK